MRLGRSTGLAAFVLVLLSSAVTLQAAPASLILNVPEAVKVQSAVATAVQLKLDVTGKVQGQTITFENVLPETAYTVKLTLADGTVLQGVDMSWYNLEPAKSKEPMDEEDRKQVDDNFFGHLAFENKRNMLLIEGNHDRAVVLAELIRDSAFHSDSGGEIIWRVEVWYYKNQHGGWEKVPQQNKVLRRERFKTRAAYNADAGKLRWVAELGGIKVAKDEKKTIDLKLDKKSEPRSAPAAPAEKAE